jgi:hypothetical protein
MGKVKAHNCSDVVVATLRMNRKGSYALLQDDEERVNSS